MKTITFGIKSTAEAMRGFEEAFGAAQRRSAFEPKAGTYFTSLEAVRNFLTPRRLEVLHIIKEKNPPSLYRLAKLCGRSFPSVLKDVELLSKHGLVRLNKSKDDSRRAIQPEVAYDAINLMIGI